MDIGDKQNKRGKTSLGTFGNIHPIREKFNLKPEIEKDPQQQDPA